ncbi:MAG: Gfo/Idh/MocA family oxidoreductase, partial [bacterium]|nr:Gfo/Idh/MocA family oxidoreductase [bacterium]
IATPDHWHHDILIAAVQAGKDCYTEKPFSHTIQEGQEMVRAVRATQQIVQVGNHRRSGEHWKRAREVIQSGKIGQVVDVRVFDTRDWTRGDPWSAQIAAGLQGHLDWDRFQGKAPRRAFDPYRYFTWRWYWDYAGGLMTDIGAHMLDVNQWLTDMDGPRSAVANGGNYYFSHWETPDSVHTILDYGKFSTVFTVQFINDYENVGAFYYGSEGTVVVDELRSEVRVHPRGEKKYEAVEKWGTKYEGGDHVQNFLECVKSRKEPNSPVEVGHKVITAAHLANIAYRSGKRIQWDPATEEVIEQTRMDPTDAWLKKQI